jgi:hypothetical protein
MRSTEKWNLRRADIVWSTGGEELRPFREAGRTLMAFVLDRAFKGEL